jgi:hypothetical protein
VALTASGLSFLVIASYQLARTIEFF